VLLPLSILLQGKSKDSAICWTIELSTFEVSLIRVRVEVMSTVSTVRVPREYRASTARVPREYRASTARVPREYRELLM